MGTQIKRTYNLSMDAVALVTYSVEELHGAASQDAFVEEAIRTQARLLRDRRDAQLWRQAAHNPSYQTEVQELDALFADDDLRAWDE